MFERCWNVLVTWMARAKDAHRDATRSVAPAPVVAQVLPARQRRSRSRPVLLRIGRID